MKFKALTSCQYRLNLALMLAVFLSGPLDALQEPAILKETLHQVSGPRSVATSVDPLTFAWVKQHADASTVYVGGWWLKSGRVVQDSIRISDDGNVVSYVVQEQDGLHCVIRPVDESERRYGPYRQIKDPTTGAMPGTLELASTGAALSPTGKHVACFVETSTGWSLNFDGSSVATGGQVRKVAFHPVTEEPVALVTEGGEARFIGQGWKSEPLDIRGAPKGAFPNPILFSPAGDVIATAVYGRAGYSKVITYDQRDRKVSMFDANRPIHNFDQSVVTDSGEVYSLTPSSSVPTSKGPIHDILCNGAVVYTQVAGLHGSAKGEPVYVLRLGEQEQLCIGSKQDKLYDSLYDRAHLPTSRLLQATIHVDAVGQPSFCGTRGKRRSWNIAGQESPRYGVVSDLVWSPDRVHSGFVGITGKRIDPITARGQVVVDGKKVEGTAMIPWVPDPKANGGYSPDYRIAYPLSFSADGRFVAFLSQEEHVRLDKNSPGGLAVAIHGVGLESNSPAISIPLPGAIAATRPALSPNGRHVACAARMSDGKWRLVLDGVVGEAVLHGLPASKGPSSDWIFVSDDGTARGFAMITKGKRDVPSFRVFEATVPKRAPAGDEPSKEPAPAAQQDVVAPAPEQIDCQFLLRMLEQDQIARTDEALEGFINICLLAQCLDPAVKALEQAEKQGRGDLLRAVLSGRVRHMFSQHSEAAESFRVAQQLALQSLMERALEPKEWLLYSEALVLGPPTANGLPTDWLAAIEEALASPAASLADPWLLYAAQRKSGEIQAAAETLDKCIRLPEQSALMWLLICDAALAFGELNAAYDAVDRACKAFPTAPAPITKLMDLEVDLGNAEGAVQGSKQILERHPENAHAWFALGRAHYSLGDMDNAIEALRNALKWQSVFPTAHQNLGVAYGRGGRSTRAIYHFNISIRQWNKSPTPHHLKGLVIADLNKDPERALGCFDDAIRLDPGFQLVEARVDRAAALLMLRRRTEAVDQLNAVLEAVPNHERAMSVLRLARRR